MTTAHRPTWNPRKGNGDNLDNPSLQFSARDLPSNTKIKYRMNGQGNKDDIDKINLKQELYKRERDHLINSNLIKEDFGNEILENVKKRKLNDDNENNSIDNNNENNDINISSSNEDDSIQIFEQDKDYSYSNDNSNDNNNESDYDSDDTEKELMLELEKIKNAQNEEKEKKNDEIKQKTEQEILNGNPLLSQTIASSSSFNNFSNNEYSLKKKWYEDTVFKNQSRLEIKPKKRFINDTVRSDFHRKFLAKIIH